MRYWSKSFIPEPGIGLDLLAEAIGGQLRAEYDPLIREALPCELGQLMMRLAELSPCPRRKPASK